MSKLIFYLTLFFSCFQLPSQAHMYPKITFKYDWRSKIIDTLIAGYYKTPISAGSKIKLDYLLPCFTAAWQKQAPLIFAKLFSCFNRGFKQQSRTAFINLSHYFSYGNHYVLILGLKKFLEQKIWNRSIAPEDYFVWIIFHELLHVWIDENVKKNSPILEKYKDEHILVKSHIHLMAIQKMVYIHLNRLDLLEHTDSSYNTTAPSEYNRAWEIVNRIEGYENVLEDIMLNLN